MAMTKKSTTGLEVELFTVDGEGKLVNKADEVMDATKGKGLSSYVRQEISTCLLEIGSDPGPSVRDMALPFLEKVYEVVEIAEEKNIYLLPFGTHPAKGFSKIRSKLWYDAKVAVVGMENAKKEGKIAGFHFHYSLPRGIVDKEMEMIKQLKRSKSKEVFLNQYNFLVAADPALLTFSQSTPVWQGKHYGKDCRVIVYRDMAVEDLKSMFYYNSLFSSLPNYEFTMQDLIVLADTKKREYLRLLEKNNFPTNEIAGVPTLKFMWGPLRVNKVGTFEYRGPDMNMPTNIFSIGALIKLALLSIEKLELEVLPSDIGIDEPFTIEDGVMYVPPHSTLKYLEYQSAIKGFESQNVYSYCSKLVKLVSDISKKGETPLLGPVKKMLKEKKTMSDEMLELIKKNGHDPKKPLPDDVLNYVSLYYAKKLKENIEEAQKICKKAKI